MAEEIKQRTICDFVLYAITPKMTGVYSIAEVVDDSNKKPHQTIFICLRTDGEQSFNDSQWKSLKAVSEMVERNGGHVFNDLKSAADFMNNQSNLFKEIKIKKFLPKK